VYYIEFDLGRDKTSERLKMKEFTDKAILAARKRLEKKLGKKINDCPKTGFPSFTVYDEDGEEVGGG
jgi:hypothetical protein